MEMRPNLANGDKEHVWIYQDEATYHSNDFQNAGYWLKPGEQVLKKKGQGQLIMVSSFICERYGNLVLLQDLVEVNAVLLPLERLKVTNLCMIIYPTSKEGGDNYWNTKQMLKQVQFVP